MAENIYTHPARLPESIQGSVVAIGNFDGVHKGHQAVLKSAGRKAKAMGVPLVALTFDPHPREVLVPQKAPMRLTPLPEKAALLRHYGADAVYVVPFSLAYAKTPAGDFIQTTLQDALRARHVVVGADFAFGHNREGNVKMLAAEGAARGFSVEVMPLVAYGGQVVASTRVREYLQHGDINAARALLGHEIALLKKET